jgi:hypothetical protein
MTTTMRPPASPPDVAPDAAAARTPWPTVLVLAVALSAGLAVLLSAFAWPATQTRPREVPIAVAGPPPAVDQVRTALEEAQPGAFAVRAVTDAARARELVQDRDVAGALVLDPAGPSVIVATQGGPAVAQALVQVAQAAGGQAVEVDDVAPAPADDPRGAGLAAGALPLAIVGAAAGAVLTLRLRGPGRRAAGAVVFALVAGPTAVGILHGWFGALTGNWLAESAVISLGLAAATLGVAGLAAVAGRVGLVVGALTIVALGNPLSGASSAPALLPDGWGDLGQGLPPGAVVSALRAVSGFDGEGVTGPLTVLLVWAGVGLALLLLASVVGDRGASAHAAT